MTAQTILTNARVVTPETVLPRATVVVAEGRIVELAEGVSGLAGAIDLEGDHLIPGLVELHTDNLERHFAPRPGVRWPALPAVRAHDAELAAAGITTVFDAVTIGDLKQGNRARDLADMIEAVADAKARDLLRVDHLLHLRCEIAHERMQALVEPLVGHPLTGMLSIMDHTPGQRQFVDEAKYREYYMGKHGVSADEIGEMIVRQKRMQAEYAPANRAYVVAQARTRGYALASHDDATAEHVTEAEADGCSVAEFPTTIEAARASKAAGMAVLMGAPNLVRGGSHSGNISARALAEAGLLDVLSSDYVPASLLHAAMMLADVEGVGLAAAIRTVTDIPARAVGLDDRGRIAAGAQADLVRFAVVDGHVPLIRTVWRRGRQVL
ncbi:alpha-D-ribose 1-methylphosphonate 5-triphosphate diphosphatase [Tistrella mobilis]|uniref:alpha-D-ribose 1-methylphosphonate 5-triphosphate diphosphatase n=1 Tax=Tistrella mobilis TaxID=171437 RepID=UPI003557A1F5